MVIANCRLFIAGSWIPKATVQAALASTPLDMILEFKRDEPDFQKWQDWGKDITTTAIFAIIITAPIGLVFISYYGDKWLTQDNVKIHVNKTMRDMEEVLGARFLLSIALILRLLAAQNSVDVTSMAVCTELLKITLWQPRQFKNLGDPQSC